MSSDHTQQRHTLSTFAELPIEEKNKLMSSGYTFDAQQFNADMAKIRDKRWRLAVMPEKSKEPYMFDCYFTQADGKLECVRVRALMDKSQPLRSIDDIPAAVHEFCRTLQTDTLTYAVFRNGTRPNYSPLFALGMLYQKYGYGWFPDGKDMPETTEFLDAGYRAKV